jgi:hypothetical protein
MPSIEKPPQYPQGAQGDMFSAGAGVGGGGVGGGMPSMSMPGGGGGGGGGYGGYGGGSVRGRGVHSKHSTDVESPASPPALCPRVYMSTCAF